MPNPTEMLLVLRGRVFGGMGFGFPTGRYSVGNHPRPDVAPCVELRDFSFGVAADIVKSRWRGLCAARDWSWDPGVTMVAGLCRRNQMSMSDSLSASWVRSAVVVVAAVAAAALPGEAPASRATPAGIDAGTGRGC